MDDSHTTLQATVRGFVQGVGFRVFVRSTAWRLNLKGFVRNMPDGTLQVTASGSRPSLDVLLAELRRGPAGSHVTAVDTAWHRGEQEGLNIPFEVRF